MDANKRAILENFLYPEITPDYSKITSLKKLMEYWTKTWKYSKDRKLIQDRMLELIVIKLSTINNILPNLSNLKKLWEYWHYIPSCTPDNFQGRAIIEDKMIEILDSRLPTITDIKGIRTSNLV